MPKKPEPNVFKIGLNILAHKTEKILTMLSKTAAKKMVLFSPIKLATLADKKLVTEESMYPANLKTPKNSTGIIVLKKAELIVKDDSFKP